MSAASPDTSTLRRLLRFLKPYRAGLLLPILAYVAAAGTEVLIPKLLQLAFDDGLKEQSFPIWYVPVALIGLYMIRGSAGFAGQYLLNWTVLRGVRNLRQALTNHSLARMLDRYEIMFEGIVRAGRAT